MKKNTGIDFKFIIRYLSTIISKAFFIILLFCALVLAYYFVALKLYGAKGEKYAPPFTIYTIVSQSMTPTINVKDVIINLKVDSPSDIKVGDIITFKSTCFNSYGLTITHRVMDVQIVNGEYEFTTKGDFNEVADICPAKYSNVVGVAKVKLPQLGRVQMAVANKFGWLLIVVVPALYIIIGDIIKIIKLTRIKSDADLENKKLRDESENSSGKLDKV